ncbi:peptidylprolyl isomerase [Brevundimonas sp.]|uniref:peptidylprolyl isomerase n=1 Tax=Brevundimonas sp. TaxID=1871086 RepID=UPI0025E1902D|nr:peptidylprolyl isomerase [Brevundimonas sp.]
MRLTMLLGLLAVLVASPVVAQTPEWREVAPDNLLVIETTKGRILIEMAPDVAPLHVERVRTLARQGFYDGITFHRVIDGFMAQTGDPLGTGMGGSELPDVRGEFVFRRGTEQPYVEVTGSDTAYRRPAGGQLGVYGALPVATQPDGQMFVTRDGRVDGTAWFCPGVVGAARSGQSVDSANSQFFIMRAPNFSLNGSYTVWGRVVDGMDTVMLLRSGDPTSGRVPEAERDSMTRVRVASDIPAAERPAVRVLDPRSARFAQQVEERRAARGGSFSICDISLPSEVTN